MRHESGTRRDFLRTVGWATTVATIGSVVRGGAAAAAGKLVFVGWGGTYQDSQREAYLKPFMKETGIDIEEIKEGPRVSKLKAQVQSGVVEWDVVDFETSDMLRAAADGLLEPIDTKVVNTADVIPRAVYPYGVGSVSASTVLAYSTKKYPVGKPRPTSWQDFWDVKKFPGPRGLQDFVKTNLEFALLADGVPKEKLYPLDVERAFRSLDRIKPNVSVWWSKGAQPIQLLSDGEVDLCSAYNGRIYAARKEGSPVDLEWNGGALDFQFWCVPKGSKNKELAMKFIAFAIQPKAEAEATKYITYGPTNTKSWEYVDKTAAANLPTAPANLAKQVVLDNKWWLDNEAKLTERWEAWKLKK